MLAILWGSCHQIHRVMSHSFRDVALCNMLHFLCLSSVLNRDGRNKLYNMFSMLYKKPWSLKYTKTRFGNPIHMTEITNLYTQPTNLYRWQCPLCYTNDRVHQTIHLSHQPIQMIYATKPYKRRSSPTYTPLSLNYTPCPPTYTNVLGHQTIQMTVLTNLYKWVWPHMT